MAKVVQISNDGGSTWDNLPGSQASFNVAGEPIDDTILGQTYSSSEIGLLGWGVSSDGIWKGFAGYVAQLLKSGAATVADGEAFTLVSGKTYSIDAAAREIWDRTDTVTVWDGVTDVTDEVESIDYLFGRITFKSTYTVIGAITADISYFTPVAIGKANSYTLTMSAEEIDESDFATVQANTGYRVFTPGLRTVNLELGGIFDATEALAADVQARTELIIEVDPAGDGSSIARGYFKAVDTGQSGSVGGLEEESVNFALTVPDETVGPIVELPFNWRHTNTTMNAAIQSAIASWLGELNTYDVRYLPQGAITQSPLDGKEGDIMFTDISLSGGLDTMNVFNIELRGTGAVTTV